MLLKNHLKIKFQNFYYDKIYYKNSLSKFKDIKSFKKCDPMYQTIGYIISKKFLDKFTMNKIRIPIDNKLMYFKVKNKINYYASKDTLVSNQGLCY